ncbi:MAG: AAA family ATPase [Oscillospiraceae bacterium]|jgi:septum site-determining protein MinD|nr:AAA family ATPase [Oscillospiraceae bacterium]
MAKVIVYVSGKGGTGKSTVSATCAIMLANGQKRVLLVDCDSGMRGLDIMLALTSDIVYDLSDFVSGKCAINRCIYNCADVPLLDLIPAPFDSEDEISPELFRDIVNGLSANYDYIIIDSPAGLGGGFVTAAFAAQTAVLVANTEPTSLSGCQKARQKLVELGVDEIRLIINKFNRESFEKLGLYADLDEVIDIAGAQLLGIVPEDYALIAGMQKGELLKKHKHSPAFRALGAIARRLGSENVPLLYKG